jgi:hypothetical protein
MQIVWYILETGAVADPLDVVDDGGVLRHKDGRAVAYKPHGPRARMVSAEEIAAYRTAEMVAEEPRNIVFAVNEDEEIAAAVVAPKRAYKTRVMKAKA